MGILRFLSRFIASTNGFYIIIIAILACIILLQRACTPVVKCPEGGKPRTVIIRDTQYITKIVEKIVYRPGAVKYLPGEKIYVQMPVDTVAILKDYFASRVYNDTIAIDSIGFAYIQDTVSRNQIIARVLSAEYKIPVVIERVTTIVPPVEKNQVYIGIEAAGNKKQPISYFGPSLVLKTKKDKMYTAGVGYTIEQGFGVKAGVLWKIKLK